MPEKPLSPSGISRRAFLEGCAATALAASPTARALGPQMPAMHRNAAQHVLPLESGWLFGGKLVPGAADPAFNDSSFSRVVLPQSVVPLSWQGWDPASWEDQWIFRRHFSLPPDWHDARSEGTRFFLHFDRVLSGATPVFNGHALEPHLGGFLPFEREITELVQSENNVLAVIVDGRWLNVPPSGSTRGPASVDYLLPAGMTGSVELRAVPSIFIREFYAKPVNVMSTRPCVEITCTIDAAGSLPARFRLTATLTKEGRTIATAAHDAQIEKSAQDVSLALDHLADAELWDCDHPNLYTVEVTLHRDGTPVHTPVHIVATRIGFRDLRWELDGFYLNGKRTQLFGLDRHELYPYVGFAAPPRLLRRDAEILRHRFNCNSVRCSHYPQSEAFLDACDELGLLVWQELPGWQYIGDESWQDLAVRDVEQMIRRDRNHASIFVWGVRINESHNDPALYEKTSALARSLDSTRATTGTMTAWSVKDWNQDVFAYDDYHADLIGSVGIRPPIEGHPYMLAETVGQFNYRTGRGFAVRYRRAGDILQQTDQAIFHAQAHSRAANEPRTAGVIAWCAFDYASIMNDYKAVKCPGIADVFRINKLGAAFYLAQVDPSVRTIIEPDFYWDFGPQTPNGPGEHAAIFSNCDRLELFIDGKPHATLHPDLENYPHLKHAPFFADLKLDGASHPELRIDGYVGNKRVHSRSFSSDTAHDQLALAAEDAALRPDGADATRIIFSVVDKFGAPRAFADGSVKLELEGPGQIVGDNPFDVTGNGGAGAVYVRSIAGKTGIIRVEAEHSSLGRKSIEITVA